MVGKLLTWLEKLELQLLLLDFMIIALSTSKFQSPSPLPPIITYIEYNQNLDEYEETLILFRLFKSISTDIDCNENLDKYEEYPVLLGPFKRINEYNQNLNKYKENSMLLMLFKSMSRYSKVVFF